MVLTTTLARRPALPALTGVRALAAANIVCFHFWDPAWFGPLAPMMDNGYASVDFFFILSGFILAYNYTDKQAQGRFQRREFWRARLARLYPVYLLGLLVSIPVLKLEWRYRSTAEFFQGFFLTSVMQQGWSPLLATFWNTPAWTLSCEALFYLLFPWLLTLAWPRSRGRLALLLVLLWLVALVLPLAYMGLHPDGVAPLNRYSGGYWLRAVKFTPLPHLPAFLFGIALSYWNDRLRLSDWARFALATASLGGIVFLLMQGEKLPFLLTHDGLLAPLFGGLILGLAGTHPLAGVLSFRPFVALGEASFCLYILHFNLWQWIHTSGLLTALHLARWDPWISYLLLELAALAAYRWVEQPGRGWMQRLLPSTASR
jgi:peptidoglycan/LPS O-acetylase OafA/YrhL